MKDEIKYPLIIVGAYTGLLAMFKLPKWYEGLFENKDKGKSK